MVNPNKNKAGQGKFWTDTYPQLSLHSAAATGNVGLVKYALVNGQPQNSSLHGVLPIHAACSNGNEAVVRMLLANGADVNAPRLPRRYSNDKRSPSVSVGTSGSTPLHFAAANGHANIVELLLSVGARPDLTEKRGLTPRDVALQCGHHHVADMLANWDPTVALSLSLVDSSARRVSISGRDMPPPDLRGSRSTSNLRNADAHPSLNKKRSSSSLKNARPFASSTSLTSLRHHTRRQSPHQHEPMTYSSLTHLPTSTSSLALGRSSLPAVLEKAAHPGNTIKEALRRSSTSSSHRPEPLQLNESTHDAFGKPPLGRKNSTSSTRSALKAVFSKHRSLSSSPLPSPFSPGDGFTQVHPDKSLPATPQESTLSSPEGLPASNQTSPVQGQFPPTDPPLAMDYRSRTTSTLSAPDAATAALTGKDHSLGDVSSGPTEASTSPSINAPEPAGVDEQMEANDQFPEMGQFRTPSASGRLRANSTGSVSSAGSRLSPYASDSSVPHADGRTRARRSASNCTEPDLRHLVLSSHHGSQTDLGSPISSSWSHAGVDGTGSDASTPPTSVNYSGSPFAEGMPPKTSTGDVITPSMADALVKQAESRLLYYGSLAQTSSKTLSEQLAEYSDTLSIQQAVLRSHKARQPYTFEKLERDGGRTPLAIDEGKPVEGSKRTHTAKGHRSSPFQQGVLDYRRQPPTKLRQDGQAATKAIPPSTPASRSVVSHQRSTSQSLQYRILESNHLSAPAPQLGRTSPGSSINDPVRYASSSTSSNSSILDMPRNRNTHKRSGTVRETPVAPELIAPTASRNTPEPPFGISNLTPTARSPNKLSKGFGALKSKFTS